MASTSRRPRRFSRLRDGPAVPPCDRLNGHDRSEGQRASTKPNIYIRLTVIMRSLNDSRIGGWCPGVSTVVVRFGGGVLVDGCPGGGGSSQSGRSPFTEARGRTWRAACRRILAGRGGGCYDLDTLDLLACLATCAAARASALLARQVRSWRKRPRRERSMTTGLRRSE